MNNHEKHDKMLEEVLNEFRVKGYKIIHLHRKPIPDAIAIKNNKTVAIESTSSNLNTKIYAKKLKYTKFGFDTDDLVIIAKKIPSVAKVPPEAYFYALEMRKKGYKYREVKKELKEKFNVKVSEGTLCLWAKGIKKPLSVK